MQKTKIKRKIEKQKNPLSEQIAYLKGIITAGSKDEPARYIIDVCTENMVKKFIEMANLTDKECRAAYDPIGVDYKIAVVNKKKIDDILDVDVKDDQYKYFLRGIIDAQFADEYNGTLTFEVISEYAKDISKFLKSNRIYSRTRKHEERAIVAISGASIGKFARFVSNIDFADKNMERYLKYL